MKKLNSLFYLKKIFRLKNSQELSFHLSKKKNYKKNKNPIFNIVIYKSIKEIFSGQAKLATMLSCQSQSKVMSWAETTSQIRSLNNLIYVINKTDAMLHNYISSKLIKNKTLTKTNLNQSFKLSLSNKRFKFNFKTKKNLHTNNIHLIKIINIAINNFSNSLLALLTQTNISIKIQNFLNISNIVKKFEQILFDIFSKWKKTFFSFIISNNNNIKQVKKNFTLKFINSICIINEKTFCEEEIILFLQPNINKLMFDLNFLSLLKSKQSFQLSNTMKNYLKKSFKLSKTLVTTFCKHHTIFGLKHCYKVLNTQSFKQKIYVLFQKILQNKKFKIQKISSMFFIQNLFNTLKTLKTFNFFNFLTFVFFKKKIIIFNKNYFNKLQNKFLNKKRKFAIFLFQFFFKNKKRSIKNYINKFFSNVNFLKKKLNFSFIQFFLELQFSLFNFLKNYEKFIIENSFLHVFLPVGWLGGAAPPGGYAPLPPQKQRQQKLNIKKEMKKKVLYQKFFIFYKFKIKTKVYDFIKNHQKQTKLFCCLFLKNKVKIGSNVVMTSLNFYKHSCPLVGSPMFLPKCSAQPFGQGVGKFFTVFFFSVKNNFWKRSFILTNNKKTYQAKKIYAVDSKKTFSQIDYPASADVCKLGKSTHASASWWSPSRLDKRAIEQGCKYTQEKKQKDFTFSFNQLFKFSLYLKEKLLISISKVAEKKTFNLASKNSILNKSIKKNNVFIFLKFIKKNIQLFFEYFLNLNFLKTHIDFFQNWNDFQIIFHQQLKFLLFSFQTKIQKNINFSKQNLIYSFDYLTFFSFLNRFPNPLAIVVTGISGISKQIQKQLIINIQTNKNYAFLNMFHQFYFVYSKNLSSLYIGCEYTQQYFNNIHKIHLLNTFEKSCYDTTKQNFLFLFAGAVSASLLSPSFASLAVPKARLRPSRTQEKIKRNQKIAFDFFVIFFYNFYFYFEKIFFHLFKHFKIQELKNSFCKKYCLFTFVMFCCFQNFCIKNKLFKNYLLDPIDLIFNCYYENFFIFYSNIFLFSKHQKFVQFIKIYFSKFKILKKWFFNFFDSCQYAIHNNWYIEYKCIQEKIKIYLLGQSPTAPASFLALPEELGRKRAGQASTVLCSNKAEGWTSASQKNHFLKNISVINIFKVFLMNISKKQRGTQHLLQFQKIFWFISNKTLFWPTKLNSLTYFSFSTFLSSFLSQKNQNFLLSNQKRFRKNIFSKNFSSLNFDGFSISLKSTFQNNSKVFFFFEKTLTEKNINIHLKECQQIIKNSIGQKQLFFMKKLQTKMKIWCKKYNKISTKKIFYYCDSMLLKFLWSWAKKTHPNKNKIWIQKKYFHFLHSNKWFFGKKVGKMFICLPLHSQTKISTPKAS